MALDFQYHWPDQPLGPERGWRDEGGDCRVRTLPESREQLAADSRWPAFFPSPICLVTTADGSHTALEKVVGPSIVNRFPYIAALSFCRENLSDRHHVRGRFTEILEAGKTAVIQFLPQGEELAAALDSILTIPEDRSHERIAASGLTTRPARTNPSPVFDDAYMAYEVRLVEPGKDLSGEAIYQVPWSDIGSHRIYFLEINAIQLRQDIARRDKQILWHGLPEWTPQDGPTAAGVTDTDGVTAGKYVKGYSPIYRFPSSTTASFESDETMNGMAVRYLPSLPQDQVEVDNDRARWPCFFPSPVGMITSWAGDKPNLMPCGSTTVVSRHPLVISPCVSYGAINERYAPRASLDFIRQLGWFGCGVPYIDDPVIEAIRYAGTVSFADDVDKIAHAGLAVSEGGRVPVLSNMPVFFECQVIGEEKLGTHVMFFGEVKKIYVRKDVTTDNPLSWCPWADVVETEV